MVARTCLGVTLQYIACLAGTPVHELSLVTAQSFIITKQAILRAEFTKPTSSLYTFPLRILLINHIYLYSAYCYIFFVVKIK